jgi:serine protease Do
VSICGNQDLNVHGHDLICEFCRTVVLNPKTTETIIIPDPEPINDDYINLASLIDSVLTIHNADRVGTGFVVDESGLILTNQHVIGDAEVVYGVFDGSPISYPMYPIHLGDEDRDLCLLQLDSNNIFTPLRFSSTTPKLGDEVVTIGNPHGIGLSIAKGFVSRLDEDSNLQLNMQLNPGNSGGPVLNEAGHVIGIVSYLIQELSGMSFAIGNETILEFIESFEGDE